MQNDFDLNNDHELIYFYRMGNKKPINIIIQKYHQEIQYIKLWTFKKFYNLPLELCDFDSITYFATIISLEKYNHKYKNTFKNYLLANIRWNMLNLINKYLNKKHTVINNAIAIDENLISIKYQEQNSYKNNSKYRDYIFNNLNKLSNVEKNIFMYKLDGKSNSEIVEITNFNYKKIDNAIQRSIKKLALLINEVDI